MSDPAEDMVDDAPEAVETDLQPLEAPADDGPSVEDRALTMGWTPKGQFKGDPEKWVDAETFVKRGEEFLPFLKANNRRLEKALEVSNARFAKLEKSIARSIEHISKAEAKAYERAKRDLEAELDQAAANGDAAAVRAATQGIVELEREVAAKPAENTDQDLIDAFKEANPWFGADEDMTAYAVGLRFPPDMPVAQQMKEIEAKARKTFAHKFENPARRAPAAVEGASSAPRRQGKTYADLPSDAKAMCDEFCRDIKGFTKEKFVKDYFA